MRPPIESADVVQYLTFDIQPSLAPCGNIAIHGTEASGKSAVTAGVLEMLSSAAQLDASADTSSDAAARESSLDYAIVDSNKCVTARHLFERTVAKVSDAVRYLGPKARRCETLSQLTVELSNMLKYGDHPDDWRFVLVFDAIDRQRDAPTTLLPGLARLSEVVCPRT